MTARTDTVLIPIIDGELADTTEAIAPPWLRPPVTATYRSPRAGLTHRWHRVRTSPFADHLRAGARRGLAVMGVVAVAITVVVLLRGAHVAAGLLGMNPRDLPVFVACLAAAVLSVIAIPLLLRVERNPNSFLSRLVDGPDETNREVTR